MIKKGTGKMFVYTDGRISYFCSNRCEKNLLKLRRDPKRITWTKTYQDLKKGMAKEKEARPEEKAPKKEQKEKPRKEEKIEEGAK